MNDTLNMFNNSDFERDLENNFNTALNLSCENHSYESLMEFLSSDKIVEKQLAVLELTEIKSNRDAFLLVSNLVGQNGKIREAVAFKISELAQNPLYIDYFNDEKVLNLFLQGIMDINGNVCRHMVNLTVLDYFRLFLSKKLPESIRNILDEISKLDKNDKQYKISKRNFQLYWALEALFCIVEKINPIEIKDILFVTAGFEDYTIREKTAKILSMVDDELFDGIKINLSKDENYYVRRYIGK